MSLSIDGRKIASLHFTGILGCGMSAVAQFVRWMGCAVSGSDRLAGSPEVASTQDGLLRLGCRLLPQDGSGIKEHPDAVVVSTAIEDSNADVCAARKSGIPVLHRAEVLATIVAAHRTIAVAGTSGKSTVTAMIFEFARHCGFDLSLIGGAALLRLSEMGYPGNAWHGNSDLLVIEADESDGSLVRYRPWCSVVLNVSKDHKPVEETLSLFSRLAVNSHIVVKNADDPLLAALFAHKAFGFKAEADYRFDELMLRPDGISGRRGGLRYDLPIPGRHNASNLLAALCVCDQLGCNGSRLAEAVAAYRGIARRFDVAHSARGVIVVDDFAHNPAKVRAAIETAHGLSPRVIAVFQPHGFEPTRFLYDDFVRVFRESLDKEDVLILQPIYYAGGSVRRDISSYDLANEIARAGVRVFTPPDRNHTIELLRSLARSGDCVLSMGARDPSLQTFARQILAALS